MSQDATLSRDCAGTGGFTYFYQFEHLGPPKGILVFDCAWDTVCAVRTWVNYYDILVRGAFGNYLDLLREVTLSPLMGILL